MRAVNPYIVGNPIKEQSGFFGRQDIFREVMQILRQPGSNAIVLYGQRRIGKTSVLLQLEKQLRQASDAPSGEPTVASREGLVYGSNVSVVVACAHNGTI